jgi:predicted nucleic acid-binding protein
MIVYIESNFVLELAYLQEEHQSALLILEHAEGRRIRLTMPAFCGGEPYEKMARRARDRKALRDMLSQEVRELSRSQPYIDAGTLSRDIARVLTKSASEEKDRLDAALSRIVQVAEIVPLDGPILARSLACQVSFGLSPQDAIVFASVCAHLDVSPAGEQKLFVTRDFKDFLTPDIEDVLDRSSCKLLTRFSDALGYIESVINSPT